MNELESIKALLESHDDKTGFYWPIIILLSLNLLAALANFILAFYLKKWESKQYRLQVREDRRITIYEDLYRKIEQLTYHDGRQNVQDLIDKISDIERYVSQNGIYISKEIQTTTFEGLDYFRRVTTDFRNKDYDIENQLLNDFVRLFNK